ncbi:hypothetical protein HPB50_010021 [Hyalomma asiaticum]|uniref:Uncharacterized protein n=1 Tax=Hyalomma asiaticum TaxID=266040 RepID=A0ACB7S2T3_HYAAI|nr:hypothetical protein HPB50_010021 [Hyalomma asiaticum]
MGHELVLQELCAINCGERTYNYVRSFLTDRTATVGIGEIRSSTFSLPNRGTPQGAILSPLLFNICMARLARQLDSIPDLGYALYADDITLWVTRGPLSYKENTLQEGAQTVHLFAESCGMSSSPEKSELVRVHGRGYRNGLPFELKIGDRRIRQVEKARIFGLWIQSNRHADNTLKTTHDS